MGYFKISVQDAVLFSLIILCILGHLTKTSLKFWYYESDHVQEFEVDTNSMEASKLIIDWNYFGKGILLLIWMVVISVLVYSVGYFYIGNTL